MKRSAALAGAGLVATTMLVWSGINASAADLEDEPSIAAAQVRSEPDEMVQTVRYFDHTISLGDAIALTEEQKIDAVGFRVENPNVVGEYLISDGLTADGYTAWFEDLYGTKPQIVGVLVEVPGELIETPEPEDDAQQWRTESDVPDPTVTVPVPLPEISTDVEEFVAPPPNGGNAWDSFAEPASPEQLDAASTDTESAASPMLAAAVPSSQSWFPRDMETRIERVAGRQYFNTFANWRSGSSASTRPQQVNTVQGITRTIDYGMEFEVNLYNDTMVAGLRPFCSGGYEQDFLAENQGYSWGVTTGANSIALTTGAYADTNDVADSCKKNAMSVGLSMPWNIPTNSRGFQQVLISINAPVGQSTANRVESGVQLVDNLYCQTFPTAAKTDCMGDALISPPVDPRRLSLREGRRWVAGPHLCYFSGDFGASVALTIPRGDGCYHG